jgi:hypothetical protein
LAKKAHFLMTEKEIIGGAAVVVGLSGQGVYLWQVFRRTVKPHIFSWFIWGLLGLIGSAAQYTANAGPGSWSVGASAIFCFFIAIVGFFHGEKTITRSDWIYFLLLLSAIPAWLITKNPLWAAVIVSAIDAGAFYPSFRKAWSRPHDEGLMAFLAYVAQMVLSLAALETYSLTTALYPAVLLSMNAAMTLMLLYRRKILI